MKAEDQQHQPATTAPAVPHPHPAPSPVAETLGELWLLTRKWAARNYKPITAVALAVAAVLVFQFVRGSRLAEASSLNTQLTSATSLGDLDRFAKEHPNATAGRLARLMAARIRLGPDGIEALQERTPERRKKAIENVEAARDEFPKLASEFAADKTIHVQCLLAAGKAEEALVGIPKEGNVNEFRGSVEKAAEWFEKAAAAAKDTQVGTDAKAYADKLRANAGEVARVQAQLNNLMAPPPAPSIDLPKSPVGSSPPIPGLPGGPSATPGAPPLAPSSTPPTPPAPPEPKAPDAKTPDAKAPDAKAVEPKAPDAKTPEPKPAEPKAPVTKTPEPKPVEPKAPDAKAAPEKK